MKTNWQIAIATLALAVMTAPGATDPADRKVAFYQDSMHPWVKSDRPGKCTICDMDLTPIYEGQAGFGSSSNLVVLSSNQITVLDVQAEPVKRRALTRSLRVAGVLDANETKKVIVSAPARGRIDDLAVEYAGVEVEQGQKLITLFSPELVQLRKTLLAVRQAAGSTNVAARSATDPGVYTGDILAPQSGLVLERNVYTGQYVAEGDRMLTIVDANVVWFRFDVYQAQLPWFEIGQTIEVEVSGVSGKIFRAVIAAVEPAFNEQTRTVKVRADIDNPLVEVKGRKYRQLKYGMYAEGTLRVELADVLVVPRTAMLFPGGTAYAYVEKGAGAYERRRLKLGRQGDDCWEVLKGVEEGENVVTSGNMLIDAQAQFSMSSDPGEMGTEEPSIVDPVPVPVGSEKVVGANPLAIPSAMSATMAEAPRTAALPRLANAQAGGARSDRMAAIMSPGSELQGVRRAAILRELEMKSNAPPASPAASRVSSDLSSAQRDALLALVAAGDGISRALAADDPVKFVQIVTSQPNALLALETQMGDDPRWSPLVKKVAELARNKPAPSLEEARTQFLPFSTALVELVKQLRKADPVFADLKVYHCPMAPKPGLWMQAKGPLANPFYGSKMLRCGEEVAP